MRSAARSALLLLGLCAPTSAGESARAQFVFKGVSGGVALLAPSDCPLIGVQVESGPRTLERNHVLSCAVRERVQVVKPKEGEDYLVTEVALYCDGGQVLVVKGIEFVRSGGR